MPSVVTYLRRFVLIVIAIAVLVSALNIAFGTLLPAEATFFGLQITTRQVIQSAVIVITGFLVLLLIRRFSKDMKRIVGPYPASVFSYVLMVLDAFAVLVSILGILNISANSLLLGGGFGAIIVGLAVSALFGNIISGALMLFAKPVVVGDDVLINNIPGRVEEISTLFTKIVNESGTETIIPNSALISGGVTLTKAPSQAAEITRLPFQVGDRIYTSYVSGQGLVKSFDSLYTTVVLDDGREVRIPNNGIMTGNISVALLSHGSGADFRLSLKVGWDVEETIKAIKAEAAADLGLFKSPLQVLYSSLDNDEVGIEVSGNVEASKLPEARSRLLRAAYMARERRHQGE